MTLKQRAEYWTTIAMLTDQRPIWWKRFCIAAVFCFTPPRLR